ncbi:RNA-directed DNA polymerase, eukaryota, reverse transcriptase zinc-binding domain protein [Tanacetum coccineum]
MENVVECISVDKVDCGSIGMESQNNNVSESITVDTTSPCTKSNEKFVANKENVVDSMENNLYVEALSKNLIESDNKLFSVPTSVNEKGEEVVIFDEDLFKDEEGMNLVLEKSPWMVNDRPFIVQKWDPEVTIVKSAPCKIPVWIKLFNVPLEAWSIKGISTLSIRLGRPIMMDKITADMCNWGIGRLGYARVLVEIEVGKGFLDEIEINYVDKQNLKKNSKWVKVEYSWKPMVCNHCKVFRHSFFKCTLRPRTKEEKEKVNIVGNKGKSKEGYTEVRNGRNFNGFSVSSKPVVKDKVTNVKQPRVVNEDPPPRLAKLWNVNEENHSKNTDEIMLDKRLIVDEFVKKKLQPSISETKDWFYDMIKGMSTEFKQKELRKYIVEEKLQMLAILETHLKTKNIAKIANSMFGSWNWLSNVDQSPTSYKIKFYASIVYASNNGNKIRELWTSLQMNMRIVAIHPWVIMGDFNVTLKPEEHSNGGSGSNIDMQEFSDLVNAVEVDDLCSSGFYFTWTKSLKNPNNSTLKKLDKILVNDSFITKYSRAHSVFLPYLIPDHSPGVLIFPEVAKGWDINIHGCHMFKVVKKLRNLKKPLNQLNWKHGNLFDKAKNLKDSLQVAQEDVDKDPFNVEKKKNAIFILEEYTEVSKDELKKHKNRVESICDENGIRFWGDDVANQIEKHFQNFLGASNQVMPLEQLGDIVQLKLNIKDAEAMIVEVSDKEIKEAMFDIDSLKASEDSKFKYHYDCKELKLTHLCFADDLLMLCNEDADSLKVMKKSLEEFSKVSGLFPNHSKSIIFFGSILENTKQELLDVMPFKCGKLPMKYLGVPLLTKMLGVNDCKCLIESVERRIKCWRNRVLSYAGRIQLIASGLASMQNYWASVYMLPNTVVMDLEKLFRRFIWNLGDSVKVDHSVNDSWGWKNMLMLRDKVKPRVLYKIGNGRDTSAWHDKWCQMGPLDRIVSNRDLYDSRLAMDAKIADIITNNRWNWPDGWVEEFPDLEQIPNLVIDAEATYKVCWVNSDNKEVNFSTKVAWLSLRRY